jgi:hypothetical protein
MKKTVIVTKISIISQQQDIRAGDENKDRKDVKFEVFDLGVLHNVGGNIDIRVDHFKETVGIRCNQTNYVLSGKQNIKWHHHP